MNLTIRFLFSLFILMVISSCWQDFWMLRSLTTFSTSLPLGFFEMKGWGKCFTFHFGHTRVFVENFNYWHNRFKIFTSRKKRLRVWYVQTRYTWEKNLVNVSQSSSSLDMVLPSTKRVRFLLFQLFCVNKDGTVLKKLLLSMTVLVSKFSKYDFLVFFKSCLQIFPWVF